MEIGNESAARGPAGKVSSLCLTPPAAGNGRRWGGGDRLLFTVRDLIARRFHYLCTNVTFSSDQGARPPLAARLASSQTIVQKVFSQSGLPGQTEVSGGTERRRYAKDIKNKRRVTNTKLLTVQHSGRGQYVLTYFIDFTSAISCINYSYCYYYHRFTISK